jgi:inhibitor of cysteine peptidase
MTIRKLWHTVVLLAMLAAIVILTACGTSSEALFDADVKSAEEGMEEQNPGAALTLGAKDNGRAIELASGQELVVSLESNPTTGYGWEVSGIDGAVLVQLGEAEYAQGGAEGMVGAGGTETFRFTAQGSGQTTLTLIYHRAWEKDVEPIETFSVDVTVN